MFSEAFKEFEKETSKLREEKGAQSTGQTAAGTEAGNGGKPAGNEPFGDMSSMFKDFERIAKESADKPNSGTGGSSAEDPFSKLLSGLMGPGGEEDDGNFDDK